MAQQDERHAKILQAAYSSSSANNSLAKKKGNLTSRSTHDLLLLSSLNPQEIERLQRQK